MDKEKQQVQFGDNKPENNSQTTKPNVGLDANLHTTQYFDGTENNVAQAMAELEEIEQEKKHKRNRMISTIPMSIAPIIVWSIALSFVIKHGGNVSEGNDGGAAVWILILYYTYGGGLAWAALSINNIYKGLKNKEYTKLYAALLALKIISIIMVIRYFSIIALAH